MQNSYICALFEYIQYTFMQGKGFIKLTLILLTVVSLLQFLYILPTRKVEKNAEAYAARLTQGMPEGREKISEQRNLVSAYLDSMSSEVVFSIPLFKNFTYDELKRQNLNLGLDLKGGQSVLLEVDMKDLVHELANRSKDPSFLAALENAEQRRLESPSDFVSLFGSEFEKIAEGKKLANIFMTNEVIREKINSQSSNGEVVRAIRDMTKDVVRLTYNRLKQRIDKLGVAQPSISLDDTRDLILVELPGIDNPERARNFLSASAQLEFWDIYRVSDPGVMAYFTAADDLLKSQASGGEEKEIRYDTIYKVDELGNATTEIENIIEASDDFNLGQGPLLSQLAVNNGSLAVESVIGIADRNKRATISQLLNNEDVRRLFPSDAKFLWSAKPITDQNGLFTTNYELYMIKMPLGSEKAPLEGDAVVSASQYPDPLDATVKVTLSMNSEGAKKWAEMTTKAAQDRNRPIAIALDNEIVSAPNVQQAITGGVSSISGNFTIAEATDLASILEVGKLPARVRIAQESTVGPSLGKANINKSIISLVAGLALVLIFMMLYYGGAGIISIVALFSNLFFIFAALASLGTVLTVPGLAGIVLTIGMAVDANVIIFERIREELRSGKSMLQAISDGFQQSYSAIIDANVTTIGVAIILAWFGLGPIKGFAVVLIVGVLCTMLTAVLFAKLLMDWWTKDKGKSITVWSEWSKNTLANLNIDWIGKRKIAYVISATIISIGLISIFTKGFDLGVDFKGGYSYTVQMDQASDAQKIREALAESFGTEPVVKAVDISDTYQIVTSYKIDDPSETAVDDVVLKLFEGINALQGGGLDFEKFKATDDLGQTHITSSSKVLPTIADDIKSSSFKAGIFALLAIFLYIAIRFSKWQFSLGAVAALFHDSLITLGIFSIFWGILPIRLEIDQIFIGALLTVIGYSINDTVIVFDRIREYMGIYTSKTTDEVLNMAINSTLSRTVITSMTTLFVVLVLLIFGGGSIKGFAFALLVGVIVGTYSSIFVATPIVRDLVKDMSTKKTVEKKHFSRALK